MLRPAELQRQRFSLTTGVELDVELGGRGAPLLFLHGFPESSNTWRHQLAEFVGDHFVVAPDQRGFARSSKPENVEDYAIDHMVADTIALADALGLDRFTLIGHDWGASVAWKTALAHAGRVSRLVIMNGPHPAVFQKSLFDDQAQRAASQYINLFRTPGIESFAHAIGIARFVDEGFLPRIAPAKLSFEERAVYIDEWSQPGALTAIHNWYRASPLIVPLDPDFVAPAWTAAYPPSLQGPSLGDAKPPAWLDKPFPELAMPMRLIWGIDDKALLPSQLAGMRTAMPGMSVVEVACGHFVPWMAPDAVNAALREFFLLVPA